MTPRDYKIGTRLGVGFGVILFLMIVVSVGGTALSKSSRNDLAKVMSAAETKSLLAADMKAKVLEQSAVLRNIGLHSEIKAMQAEEDRARSIGKAFGVLRASMALLAETPEEKVILADLEKLDKEIEAPVLQAIGLSTSFRNEEAAKILVGEMDPIVQKMLSALGKLIDLQKKSNENAVTEAIQSGDRQSMAIIFVEVMVLLFAAALAWWMTRSITAPLRESVEISRRVALGDLGSRITISGRDEAAELLSALRNMNDNLGGMVSSIRAGSENIAIAAAQVASGNQQLESRTEDHASSLEETASTLEEFTATVRQNAENARMASELAATASATARRGGESVAKVVQTMQEVTTSSKRISEIVNVIDGISFQTNILALNAAVEAARAGEHGRGFAVVASEVRSLSQRSAASAKEIRGLITESVERVEASAQLVEEAGRIMDDVVGSVEKVSEIMPEIASASHEQSTGIDQINKAIAQMDTVVQMNASIVQQTAAAAASMSNEAGNLAQAVAKFRLADGDGSMKASTPPATIASGAGASRPGRKAGHAVAVRTRAQAQALPDADKGEWKEY